MCNLISNNYKEPYRTNKPFMPWKFVLNFFLTKKNFLRFKKGVKSNDNGNCCGIYRDNAKYRTQ